MKTERPRLLVLASTYPRWRNDSAPGFVHELARRLTQKFDITVLTSHFPGSKTREILDGVTVLRFRYAPARLERLVYDGGILVNLRKRPWTCLLVLPFLVSMLACTLRELRSGGFALVHAHWIIPQGLVAVAVRTLGRIPIPILCTAHGSDLFGLRGRIGTFLKRLVLRRVDVITAASSAMAREAGRILPGIPRAHILPMGVDLQEQFTPGSTVRREDGLLVFVGRLVENKGVAVLLDAFDQLRRSNPSVRLEIIGDGPERGSLEKRILSLGLQDRVTFVGAMTQQDVVDRLRRATLFIMPSTGQEGFGLVLVEAMGCGAPVIASNFPAVHDIVHEDIAVLVEPGNHRQLAEACQRLLEDGTRRAQMSVAARAHVAERFDWSITSDGYAKIITAMIQAGRNPQEKK